MTRFSVACEDAPPTWHRKLARAVERVNWLANRGYGHHDGLMIWDRQTGRSFTARGPVTTVEVELALNTAGWQSERSYR